MPLLLGRGAWRPVLAVLAWSVMAVPADGQEAASRWRRIAHGDVEVIGNAGHTSVRTVASQMAVVRDALSALAPATARMSVPVTVLLDCDATHRPAIVERPWRVYVVGRCGAVSDAEGDAVERYARIVLRRAVHPLPLWLEVGVARFAMAAVRVPTAGFEFATFQAADVRGYQHPTAPAREVFSAREASEIWQNRQRRAAFPRQSLVYVHRIVQRGNLDACFGHPQTREDPAVRLERCLGGDIDTFHAAVMARWPEGLARVGVGRDVAPSAPDERGLSDAEWKVRVIEAHIATGVLPLAKRGVGEWGLTAGSHPGMPGLLARMALASGDAARARRLFDEAVGPHPDPLDAYHYAAFLLAPALRTGTVEKLPGPDAVRAQELLTGTLRQHPFADASALHGIAMLATGDHSRAIESLTTAVETSWNESSALWLARAYAAARLSASARRLAASLRDASDRVEIQRQAERLLRDVPADQGDASGVPVLPPLTAGEQRARGRLLSIDCGQDWVSLVVDTRQGTERFVTARLSLVRFVSFGAAPAPAICGPRTAPESVVVSWRTASTQPAYATGVVSTVVFLEQ